MYNVTGTTIGMTHILLPFLVLPLFASMQRIDRDLLRAAAALGATPGFVFWQVFFPLSLPGLTAGALLVFVLSIGYYVTPAASRRRLDRDDWAAHPAQCRAVQLLGRRKRRLRRAARDRARRCSG